MTVPFVYQRAESVEDAVVRLAEPRTLPMGGGTDLLVTIDEGIYAPAAVVDLRAVPASDSVELREDGTLRMGASARIEHLANHPLIRERYGALAEACSVVATPALREMGTLGGNLCQRPRCWYFRLEEVNCLKKGGSECYAAKGENKYNAIIGGGPSYIVHPSDLAPMLLALGATVTVMGAAGKRVIPLDKFFTLPSEGNIRRENVLKNEEIITEIQVPASPLAARSTYLKFKERESLDFALASAAVAVRLSGRTVQDARIVLGGVAPVPWRVPAAEKFLVGKELKPDVLAEAGKIALADARPLEKNAYKVPLAQTLVRRALAKAGGV